MVASALRKRIPQHQEQSEFEADVLDGLRTTPKHIPAKYFYDAVGSDLFEDASAEATYLVGLGPLDKASTLDAWTRVTSALVFPRRRIGVLQDGYEASFLRLACDPLADFSCVRRVTLAMKQGLLLGLR